MPKKARSEATSAHALMAAFAVDRAYSKILKENGATQDGLFCGMSVMDVAVVIEKAYQQDPKAHSDADVRRLSQDPPLSRLEYYHNYMWPLIPRLLGG